MSGAAATARRAGPAPCGWWRHRTPAPAAAACAAAPATAPQSRRCCRCCRCCSPLRPRPPPSPPPPEAATQRHRRRRAAAAVAPPPPRGAHPPAAATGARCPGAGERAAVGRAGGPSRRRAACAVVDSGDDACAWPWPSGRTRPRPGRCVAWIRPLCLPRALALASNAPR
eukprot:scaffold77234_cov66-Phaeocystis_antarctica.AAC.4